MATPNDTPAPTKPLMAGCQQEPCSTVFYFGCIRQSGHYLWHPTQGQVRRMDKAQPWGNYIDAGIFKDSKDKERLGVVHATHFKGWTMVAWADRSVDSRHGSHSTFIVEAEVTPERLIELAREQWPQVFSRPGFPDLSNAKVEGPADSATSPKPTDSPQ